MVSRKGGGVVRSEEGGRGGNGKLRGEEGRVNSERGGGSSEE